MATIRHWIVSSFLAACIVLIAPQKSVVADDGPTKFLQAYITAAKEAYSSTYSQYPPPKSEIEIAANTITALRDDWLTPTVPSSDMWFYKWHTGMGFSLSRPQVLGKSVSILVKIEPQLSGNVIAYPATQLGRYELELLGSRWQIRSFSATPSYPFPPLATEVGPEDTLSAYWMQRKKLIPPGRKDYTAGSRPQLFWKLPKAANSPAQLESLKEQILFLLYRPLSWQITELTLGGDAAKVRADMTVGDLTQIKLHKGQFTQSIEYSLIRYDNNWYITGFRNLDEISQAEQKIEAKMLLEERLRQTADLPPPAGPREIVDAYLRGLQIFYPPDGSTPQFSGAGPQLEREHREKFWNPRDRNARKASALERIRFAIPTFRPLNWTISSVEQNGTEVNIRVTFDTPPTNALEAMIKAGQFSNTADYTLDQYKGRWVIVNYQSRK